jgi:hypothetical protein
VPGASCAAVRCAWGARCSTRIVAWSRTTAMPNMRILRFGTGRQRMVLERGTNPRLSRRPCACEYGATIVSRGIGGRRETAPSELISTSSRFFPVGDVGNGGGGLGEQHTHTHTTHTHAHTHTRTRTHRGHVAQQPAHPPGRRPHRGRALGRCRERRARRQRRHRRAQSRRRRRRHRHCRSRPYTANVNKLRIGRQAQQGRPWSLPWTRGFRHGATENGAWTRGSALTFVACV